MNDPRYVKDYRRLKRDALSPYKRAIVMPAASRWKELSRFVLFATHASIAYGITHDLVTAHFFEMDLATRAFDILVAYVWAHTASGIQRKVQYWTKTSKVTANGVATFSVTDSTPLTAGADRISVNVTATGRSDLSFHYTLQLAPSSVAIVRSYNYP